MNDALRNAYGDRDKPPNTLYSSVWEPHERGSILVAAIFEAFFETYQRRIRDLVRIASGGTGRLPEGDLHPDLVNRIADEAGKTAEYVLAMGVRAFEYLPPVDITFGDYLRALVTADREQFPADEKRQRESTIEAFRRRGIFPDDVYSLAEDSLRWPLVSEAGMRIKPLPDAPIDELLQDEARTYGAFRRQARTSDSERILRSWKAALTTNATVNAKNFLLDPRLPIEAEGFHATHRTLADGQLRIEIVAQFTQKYAPANNAEREALGGLDVRGGTTVVASADGEVRYVIPKPVPSALPGVRKRQQAVERLVAWVEHCDERDPGLAWEGPAYMRQRMASRINFAAAHRGLMRVPR